MRLNYGHIVNSATTVLDYGGIADPASAWLDYGTIVDLFPELPGLSWERSSRTPAFKTLAHESSTGKETRVGRRPWPRWKWARKFELLRSTDVLQEWQELVGFFADHGGAARSFLFEDPEDCFISDQFIGLGDGAATAFQLSRDLGPYRGEPITEINGTPSIYIDGVLQTTGWTLGAYGLVTFTSPPALNAEISATFSYWWRVRFVDDEAEFENFMYKFWTLSQVELISIL